MTSTVINLNDTSIFDPSIIDLPCILKPRLYHYGSESYYQRFKYSYFIQKDATDHPNLLYKKIIMEVLYKPDETYRINDGMTGKCWIVTIDDNQTDNVHKKITKYYIRNWIDLVHYFEEKGFAFVTDK